MGNINIDTKIRKHVVKTKSGIGKMIRAHFLSSIIAPIILGIMLAVHLNGRLEVFNFLFVLIVGIGLHVAINVYNDICDTIQGIDKVNVHRSDSSGGSGVLLDNPELMGEMFLLARKRKTMSEVHCLADRLFAVGIYQDQLNPNPTNHECI